MLRNKWVWNWLLKKDVNGNLLSDYVRKIVQTVFVTCWCKEKKLYITVDLSKRGLNYMQCKINKNTLKMKKCF